MTSHPEATDPLLDRYLQLEGRIHLTGLQALIRISLDQLRRDRKAGRRVGALYSGYPGSPLAALDRTLQSLAPLLAREDVRLVPGLNEELAAGAVCGTQMLDLFPHSRYDGVLGLWFGKAPGLDRSLDVMRHANFTGISRWGGALALVGDDPASKSSSLPSHSEHALAHAYLPTLVPADPADVLRLGRHAFALSRYAGLWVGLKIASDVADSGMIVELPSEESPLSLPPLDLHGRRFEKRLDPRLLAPQVNRIEEELIYERMQAVQHYAAACDLNSIEGTRGDERIGLVASGRLCRELETALDRLELSPARSGGSGIRVLRVRLVYPLEPQRVREFARGLEKVVVIDERRGFLEEQVRGALFDLPGHPGVCGQYTEDGRPWIARHVDISAETLALDLAPFLARSLDLPEIERRVEGLAALAKLGDSAVSGDRRKPHFCSGCPHTRSTQIPDGSVAGGGIGCHTLALLEEDRGIQFIGAMGSEGSPWIGLAPYVDTPHLFQNMGDGTYFHSGRLAVRACVEAGVQMTFKLLYNGVIAMTGGQNAVGMKPIAPLVQDLLSDGVRRVAVVSNDVALRELAARDSRVKMLGREDYEQAMIELRAEPGVTALVYDQVCSNQRVKLERRGLRVASGDELLIQRDVCEGCGDCGRRSSCGSLWPVSTALGRKTQIHRLSCTDDRSCIDGDCPAFMSAALSRSALARPLWDSPSLPDAEVARIDGDRFEILLVGVGSMGVVTLNALLIHAAEIEGLHGLHLDQTGLAQRGGRVVSHCNLGRSPLRGSPHVGWGHADLCFALDPLGAEEPASLRMLDPGRTHTAVHGTLVPTPEIVRGRSAASTHLARIEAALALRSRSIFSLPAEKLSEAALGSARSANVTLLGAALQRGLLPLSVASVEAAIRDRGRGSAIQENLDALRLGRIAAHDPKRVDRLLGLAEPPGIGDEGSPVEAARLLGARWHAFERELFSQGPSPSRAALLARVAGFAVDLIDYQNESCAARYLDSLTRVTRAERSVAPSSLELCAAAARELYRMLAYKDEYEVARLMLRGPYRRWLEQRHGSQMEIRYHLQPPLLQHFGLRRKLALGRGIEPALRALVRLRALRGTRLDPFGWLPSRRAERALALWYPQVLDRLCAALTPGNLARAVAIAEATAEIRGFEVLKLTRTQSVRARIEGQLGEFLGSRP